MVEIICNIIIYICLIYSFYYAIIAFFAFIKIKKSNSISKVNYFSILIAARNEESVIAPLIESLKNQNYEKTKYDINVIINNCTDNTEKIAKKMGVNIINCDIPVKCKGDALKIAFQKLKSDKNIDAYLIFDADNVVHPNFLFNMNISLNNGFSVAQGRRETKNINSSWISSSYAIYFYLQSFFLSRARKNLKFSTPINGTGFMVKKEIIDLYGFNTFSLTEDIEFSGLCALNNLKIDYVEDAITYDEQPISFKVSWHQRMRWTKGSLQCLNKYSFKLIKNFFRTFSINNIDMFMIYFSPMIQIFSFLAVFANLIYQFFKMDFSNFVNLYFYNAFLSLFISYILSVLIGLFIVIYYKHTIKETYKGIFMFPIFIISWIPINIISIFKRNIVWKPIKHKLSISIDQIV